MWFCPSATPKDVKLTTDYECGPNPIFRSVDPGVSSAYAAQVASSAAAAASASALANTGIAMFEFMTREEQYLSLQNSMPAHWL